ncbi:MAG TPA: anaerobic sulfatase maturase, partial [Spirochaeta sp.]|nr:anaerobic sulfatase maturase [Spirochaeta sp.]
YIETQPEGVQEINFTWQGGEPSILGIQFYEKAVSLQKKYERKGMKILNSIQTNATLVTKEFARFFKDAGFLVGVSIDGPEHIHNHFRKYPDGRGSFTEVMRGYEILKKSGAEVNTLTVIQNYNADYPFEVYDFLCSIDSDFMQFIPVVEYYNNKVSNRSVTAAQFGDFMNSIFDRWICGDIGKRYIQHFDLFLGRYLAYPPSLCVHSPICGRALALEHNGKLYSCDHFVEQEYYLGNIAETPLDKMVDSDFQNKFGESKSTGLTNQCSNCEYLPLCYGGCLRNRILKAEQGKNHNYLCEGYKAFFNHTRPYFQAMAEAHRAHRHASEYMNYFDLSSLGRNDKCPCGSGKKFKSCHGRA